MSRKRNGYKGRLTAEQIAEGMTAAVENAVRLAGDAEVLLAHGSFATAASLAALAIEEAGKDSILRALAVARTDEEVLGCWKSYRSHTRKNSAWILPDLFASGAHPSDILLPDWALLLRQREWRARSCPRAARAHAGQVLAATRGSGEQQRLRGP